MKTEIDIAEHYLDACVRALDAGELTAEDAAEAKWWCTELQGRVLDAAVQLHGGYGYMAEYPVARAYADARVTRIYGGTTEIMKEIVGRSLAFRVSCSWDRAGLGIPTKRIPAPGGAVAPFRTLVAVAALAVPALTGCSSASSGGLRVDVDVHLGPQLGGSLGHGHRHAGRPRAWTPRGSRRSRPVSRTPTCRRRRARTPRPAPPS